MLDLTIRGASIVDGTGAAAFAGDIGIAGGMIAELGRVTTPARRVIEADGALATPGFIDPHTHYDGQAMWDESLSQSSLHGVTTAVMGNCGVGFAPLRPGEQDRLVDLMTGVEDIPGTVLHEGLDWRWESFGDYLAALERVPHAIDLAAQVTHDPVRLYAMGERALNREASTAKDVERMRALVKEALDAGAWGLSTGRLDAHRMADGRDTPGSKADRRELTALASELAGRRQPVVQYVTDFDQADGEAAFDAEFDLLEATARAAGRPLSVTLNQRFGADEQWKRVIERTDAANAAGTDIRFQVAPRAVGVIMGLTATFHPFMAHPGYVAITHLPLAEQVRALADPALRARIAAEKPTPIAGKDNSYPPMLDTMLPALPWVAMRIFRLLEGFDYEPDGGQSLGAEAMASGRPAFDVVYDALLEDEGSAILYLPLYNYAAGNLDVTRAMLSHPRSLVGLGDAGAHAGTICDSAYPTFMLPFWTRDRTRGPTLPLADIVHRMTGMQAAHFGFADRGCIAPGLRADLNVIDLAAMRLHKPYAVADLPAGGRRFLQDADGYLATLVAGVPIAEHGTMTGARPGRILRAA
jgi:N-acyl-D-aspartate/D-glutamate deacylase